MNFDIQILGSNSAAPAHGRHHSAQFLRIQDVHILMDCGEGTQLQMRRYGVRKNKINYILISHLHGDHYFGLVPLLSTMHLNGRSSDLHVFGPVGLREIITLQLKYANTRLNYDLIFHELELEEVTTIFEHKKFTVTAFPLDHRISCHGFLFKETEKPLKLIKEKVEGLQIAEINRLKNGQDVYDDNNNLLRDHKEYTYPPKKRRTYAYCSDTKYLPKLSEILKNVDLLYHEATFLEEMNDRAAETFHSTAKQAATLALNAEVGQLLIGHFSNRYKDLSPVLNEAVEIFSNTALAIEGEVFSISE